MTTRMTTRMHNAPPADLSDPEFQQSLAGTARAAGALRAVEELYRAVPAGALLSGPAGHALVPAARLSEVPSVCPVALEGSGLTVVGTDSADRAATGNMLSTALAWLRLGLSRGLFDACVDHLGRRTVHDAPLLQQQLVKGALADAATEHTAIETVLLAPVLDGATLGDLHRQLTGADRTVLRLLGAFGFTAEGPGRAALLSELIADAYACHHHPEPGTEPGTEPGAAL
ncbi:acyl-CoA dehydrogenase family protein [Streptomyces sp. NPDC021093]|uniref:acyl-CoA dehydrogenase family protein n=1 Tax=Streptomyces sp. NPDC021093 TaxID=3365112 RepID=UPI0037A1D12A